MMNLYSVHFFKAEMPIEDRDIYILMNIKPIGDLLRASGYLLGLTLLA